MGRERSGGSSGKGVKIVGGLTVLALIAAVAVLSVLYFAPSDEPASFEPQFPTSGPAEFLYLDSARVAAYLAQVNGGTYESEKLTRKLTQNLNAKIALKEAGEVGGSSANEVFAERVLKPTAASSFFALLTRLESNHVVETIRTGFFEKEVEDLPEGQFVKFKTSALLPPIYLSAYLAVLHANTLAAIFPKSATKRKLAKNFAKKVGANARAVFALQPYSLPKPESEKTASKTTKSTKSKKARRKPFVYLLPITAQLLSSERSLLKYGGGKFTVVGKMVRRFPEPTRRHDPAYVDSPTLETWEQALQHAPGDLLCRTAPKCAGEIRSGPPLTTRRLHRRIEGARQRILTALKTQTSIPKRGAVILPIAIYK